MSDQKYVELEEIEELYSRLGITEKDIIYTTDASDTYFSYGEVDIFAKRWDSSFFANARY